MIRSLYLPRHGNATTSRLVSVLAGYDVRRFSAQTKVKSSEQEEKPANDAVLVAKKKLKKELEDLPVDYSDISRAKIAIRGGIRRTECTKSYFLSELIGANVYLKPEFQQFTGSFKERGARNAILHQMREKGSSLKGVIAASAGNHALALAYHGKLLGVPVTVVMPKVAPLAKVDKCRVCSMYAI
jgi:threonine dehydratase